MKYNKLIRDKIPEILKAKGVKAEMHVAGNEEYKQKLKEKLQEEVNEFIEDSNAEELADILEVLYALAEMINVDPGQLEVVRSKKTDKRGGFKKKIILEEVED